MLRKLVPLIALLLAACGGTSDTASVTGSSSPVPAAAPIDLVGRWWGYFPGVDDATPREQRRGLEVVLVPPRERALGSRSYIFNPKLSTGRAEVVPLGEGQFRLLLPQPRKGRPAVECSFVGNLTNSDTAVGRYTNSERGEAFPLTLHRVVPGGPRPPRRALRFKAEPTAAAQPSPTPQQYLTMVINARDEYNYGYSVNYGLGSPFSGDQNDLYGSWLIGSGSATINGGASGIAYTKCLILHDEVLTFDFYNTGDTGGSKEIGSMAFSIQPDLVTAYNAGLSGPTTTEDEGYSGSIMGPDSDPGQPASSERSVEILNVGWTTTPDNLQLNCWNYAAVLGVPNNTNAGNEPEYAWTKQFQLSLVNWISDVLNSAF